MTYLDSILDHYFWSNVTKSDGCWEWAEGRRTRDGYGYFFVAKMNIYAHRFAWELANSAPIPAGKLVCHHCDNRACVNPSHLFVGTVSENSRDFDRKYSRRSKSNPIKVRGNCVNGHELTPENTYTNPIKGWKTCRQCRSADKARAAEAKLLNRII